ncbi:MAG TPA: sugar MFS transporter [Sphingomicrobium sp.]|nr:sugar MFS transporter [Sphingomicrobium sp.]
MEQARRGETSAYVIVTSLFFAWGFITSLIDPLVASVKGIFTLSDVEAQLSASAFFIAYGVMSFPAAVLLARRKAVPTVLIALGLMVAGCMLMLLAANIAQYSIVLLGLFVLASGITILQVAANPLAAALGKPEGSHFRLTFSQSFNSLGTFIGPYLGSVLFLRGIEVKEGTTITDEARSGALAGIDMAFFWIAGLILLVAALIWAGRRVITAAAPPPPVETARRGIAATFRDAISSKWALFGGAAIFLYVGAEVAIGTQMALFLNSDDVWDISLQDAGKLVSLYWGGAMVGRLIGSALLTRVPAPQLLAAFTGMAALMCAYVFAVGGVSAGYVALAIGLFNSIMFPVIFTITLERSTASEEATSGFLCFSIIGGAAIPPLVGLVSGASDYVTAFIVPAICYAILCGFALAARRADVRLRDERPAAAIH